MGDGVSKHDSVEQIFFFPLLFNAQIRSVNARCDGRIGAYVGQRRSEAAIRDLPVGEPPTKLSPCRSARGRKRGIKADDHSQNTQRDQFFHLGINPFGKITHQNNSYHYKRAQLPVHSEDEVHAGSRSCDIPHGKEQAREKCGHANNHCRPFSIVMPYCMDHRHSRKHREPICREHKCDSHKCDGNHQPYHGIPIVGAQHCRCRYVSGSDYDPRQNDTRTNTF